MTWVISDALALAQLYATLDRLATAPGPATVLIYATAMPTDTEPLTIAPDAQVTIPLASPPGAILAGVLKLAPAAGSTPVVRAWSRSTGGARRSRQCWRNWPGWLVCGRLRPENFPAGPF